MLERIKTLLGINDDLQDDLLEIIIENVSAALLAKIDSDTLPKELDFIVVEIAIRRYNRIGTEGIRSEWAGEHKIEFYDLDDEFKPYEDILDKYKDDTASTKRGRVVFF